MGKGLAAGLAILIGLALTLPYVYSALQGKTRPHGFSWLIWGLLQAIVAAVQYVNHAEPAVWSMAVAATVCFGIALLSVFRGEKNITRSDFVFLVLAVSIMPIWALTDNSLLAAVLAVAIDILGYFPTIRKSFSDPYGEKAIVWGGYVVAYSLAILAIENFSLAAVLCPAESVFMNGALAIMLLIRRRRLAAPRKFAS
jgi:hypothetical protein